MVDLVRARFIGLDGSINYRHGQTYDLIVETDDRGPGVTVRLKDGSGSCPYDNVFAFLKNWNPVVDQVADPAMPGDNRTFEATTYIDSKGKEHAIAELTEPHLLNIARKNWRTGRPHEAIDAEMKRRNLNIKEHLRKEDLE